MRRPTNIIALVCFAMSLIAFAQDATVTLTIVNDSDETICGFYLIPKLGGLTLDEMAYLHTIPARAQDEVTFDIQANDDTYTLVAFKECGKVGTVLTSWVDLDLMSESQILEYPNTHAIVLTINNESDDIICSIIGYPNMVYISYGLQIGPGETIENFFSSNDQKYFDTIESLDCEGNVLDQWYKVDISESTILTSTGTFHDVTRLSVEGLRFRRQGLYRQSLAVYREALDAARSIEAELFEAVILNNIGAVLNSQGNLGEALDYYLQALDSMRALDNRPGEGTTLASIGSLYGTQGRFDIALNYLNQGLEIIREVGDRDREGIVLSNIGLIYDYLGQYDRAIGFYEQSLAIQHTTGNLISQGVTLNNLGAIHLAQNSYDEALDVLTTALDIQDKIGDRPRFGTTLNSLGGLYERMRKYDLALDYYSKALEIRREVEDQIGEKTTLINRGRINEILGKFDGAINDFQNAVLILENVINNVTLDTAVTSLSQEFGNRSPYQRLSVLFEDLPLALNYAERGRAILTRTELTSDTIDFRTDADELLLDRELELRVEVDGAQTYLNNLLQNNSSQENVVEAQDRLESARSAYDRHLEMMQLQGGYLAREISFETASLEEIQSAIPADTTLLVYSIADTFLASTDLPKSVVFLLTQDSLDAVILDVTELEISDRVRAYALARQTGDVVLRDLYDMVFAPIASQISTSKLIISPDSSLNYVPFAALFTEANDQRHYLIDDYSIRMIPSGTTLWLLNQRETEPSTRPPLVLSQDQAPGLPPLPNAFIEALQVSQIFDTEPLRDATETQLRENVIGSDVLHISAHAELNRFAPLYSVIHLGDDDINDGRLEIREIYELDLSQGTELVILSGCETGSGGDGEDFGLMNRAFFAAGTQEVVASLWVVEDSPTADLLASFIEYRETADDNAEALRQAMLSIREEHPAPYHWASFVINGIGMK